MMQKKYDGPIPNKFKIQTCKPVTTTLLQEKLRIDIDGEFVNPTWQYYLKVELNIFFSKSAEPN